MKPNISSLGLPYHGLVDNGRLLLPNGNTIYYSALSNGDTQLISLPSSLTIHRSPVQQAADQANGHQWQNQTIIADNHLGGVNLGNDWLLYIDPNQVVWYLKLGFYVSGDQCSMSCTLQSVFGRFNGNFPKISKQLVSSETTFSKPGFLKPLNRFTFERKSDGSEVLIHVYAKLNGNNTIQYPEEMSLVEVWKLQLEGAGQLTENDSLGSGIKATLSLYKSFEEIQSVISRKIDRLEKRYKIGKVNFTEWYDPEPSIPPECQSNVYRTKFDLKLIPDGQNYTPFTLDKNTYSKTNWHGTEESISAIVRILYDAEGIIHTLAIQKGNKKLNRFYQDFKGSGTGTSALIQYEFKNGICVIKGYSPGVAEQYQGQQIVHVVTRRINHASLVLDGQIINSIQLKGETRQFAKTIIGQPVSNKNRISVKLNGKYLRKIEGKPQEIPNKMMGDPFSQFHNDDDKYGVWLEVNFGLISNNLIGKFVDRFVASDQRQIKGRESHAVISYNCSDLNIRNDLNEHFVKGTFNPVTQEINRHKKGVQCWV